VREPGPAAPRRTAMRNALGHLLLPLVIAALALTACGSSSSSTTEADPGSASPSGPIPGARVLPLVTLHAVAGHVSEAMPLDTPAQVDAFVQRFPGALVQKRVRGALRAPLAGAGSPVVGAVVASGCDVPPGVVVTADGHGGVSIVAREVASPLPECLVPVTTVALVALPSS
jgi:hypothetical protein